MRAWFEGLGFKQALLNNLKIGKFEDVSKGSKVQAGNINMPARTIPTARKGYSSLTYWSNGNGMIYYRWNEDPDKHRSYAHPSRRQSCTPDIPRARYVVTESKEASRTFGEIDWHLE